MSYFQPPPGVATTRGPAAAARRNVALEDLDRRLSAIVQRWSRDESDVALAWISAVLLHAECQLVAADALEAGDRT
jgi:hypothetical protein